MMFLDHWETIQYKRNMTCALGAPGEFIKAKSFGGFYLSLWGNDKKQGHYLEITTKSQPRHWISVSTLTRTNGSEEIIYHVDGSDPEFSFTDIDHNGEWDTWMFQPSYDEMYCYSADSGIPHTIFKSNSITMWASNRFYEVIDKGTNSFIMKGERKVPVEFQDNGMITIKNSEPEH